MEATARIVADADGAGRTRLAVLRGEPPLLLRRTGPREAGLDVPLASFAAGLDVPLASFAEVAEVHVVGGAAGPLGGDRLRLEIDVRPGAHVRVRTVAATLALPGLAGETSQTSVHATVAAGGRLEWLPEPLVAVRDCHHLARSTVELEQGARLTWREELICGRHGEECGDLRVVTAVRLGGRPLLHQDLAVGPSVSAWAGPAVLGEHRATGSLLVVDPAWATVPPPPAATEGPGAARMPLAGPAVLVGAVAPDAHELRKAVTALLGG